MYYEWYYEYYYVIGAPIRKARTKSLDKKKPHTSNQVQNTLDEEALSESTIEICLHESKYTVYLKMGNSGNIQEQKVQISPSSSDYLDR